MSSRKPNAFEQRIHQAALASNDKTLTPKEIEALVPQPADRAEAINFLLAVGLLKAVTHGDSKKISFRAVVKQELDIKKDLSSEENLVLNHIQASGNEGIWTKHLKVKTELHQTVIDRCLKSLTQKQLIKAIKGSVQHPTRKIYMMAHLEPSVEMTGGPWYTDKELDTEFIKLLSAACLKFIRDRSFPRSKSGETQPRVFYPISAAPPYPTASQVQTFLNKSRITETQLTVEHVEMLLNVLVLDGDVEKVPALGATLWESSFGDDNQTESSDDGDRSKSKKRKRSEDGAKTRKKKRRKAESSDDSDDDSDDSSSRTKPRSSRKHNSKRRTEHDQSDSESELADESRRRRKNKRPRDIDDEAESSTASSSDEDVRTRKAGTSKKRSRREASDSSSSGTVSDSEEESRKSKSKSRSSTAKTKGKGHSKSRSRRDSSPAGEYSLDFGSGAHVYRAVHAERLAHFGLSQAPCGRCPTFDFCKEGGPVNPEECVYYGEWLNTAEVKLDE